MAENTKKNLVIVESPNKAKTIGRFLGPDFHVLPSKGHIRDLKPKSFSIDTHTFAPKYEIPEDKEAIVKSLRKEAMLATDVWLASDEDREGEAIAWHLAEVLGLDAKTTKRIVFHEITQTAIQNAIEHPLTINMNLVNAQQARRVLDRIVGFKLSPILWRKVKPSLSAGRVQSVTVRLLCEREKEVQDFKVKDFFAVYAEFWGEDEKGKRCTFRAELNKHFRSLDKAKAFIDACNYADFEIVDVQRKPIRRAAPPPFMTSTLQQDAASKLGYSVSQTMRLAQGLYEAGHITYMRTDSLNLSSLCQNASKKYITEKYGPSFSHMRNFQTKSKGAQEAHEAIRPSYMDREDIEGTMAERRLYRLIRKRTLASQMSDAELEKTTVTIRIDNQEEQFIATGEVLHFEGFLKVYQNNGTEDKSDMEQTAVLPDLQVGDALAFKQITAIQRFNQRPMRFTEGTLVKKMEELGIGRPSTYSPIISTIQQRGYVEKVSFPGEERTYVTVTMEAGDEPIVEKKTETIGAEKNKLVPTDVGSVVNAYLMEEFPDIMDYNFTANSEKDFDSIAKGNKNWSETIRDFYNKFVPAVDAAMDTKTAHKVGERLLGKDPKTGREVSVKIGRFGPMVQLGSANETDKPIFAPLLKGQSLEQITLKEALQLLQLPRTLGDWDGKNVIVNNGRFGPYILCDKKFYSVPAEYDVRSITLEQAIALMEEKTNNDAKRILKSFPENADLQVLNGRYGAYISYQKKNYHLTKKVAADLDSLTLETCLAIVKEQSESVTKPSRRAKPKE